MIREATSADDALVRELRQAFESEVPDLAWREPDGDGEHADLVLVADDHGIAAVSQRGPRLWFLDVLYVRPGARGRGVGRDLLREVNERAHAAGIEMLELEVIESNERARRFYDRLGFRTIERTLAAPVGAAADDAASYGAVHVQDDDVDKVRRNAAKVLRGDVEVEHERGWIRVAAQPDLLHRLARELSFTSGVAIALWVDSGAVVRYVLFDRGSAVDEYASLPEYHGTLPPGDVVALGANATVVARLTGADAHRFRQVARTATSPSELPPADDLYREIAALLGLSV